MNKQELMNYIPEYDIEGNIIIDDHTIMFANEEEYIKKSIREIHSRINFNSVVEIGYGLGYTAQQFQDLGVSRHMIIEPNKVIYEKALEWAEGKEGVTVINDTWQDVLLTDDFDLLYYDAYELIEPNEVRMFENINATWYAEFCVPYDGEGEHQDYFVFDDWLQMLVRK